MTILKLQLKTIVSFSIQKLGTISNLYLLSIRTIFPQLLLNSLNLSLKSLKRRISIKKKVGLKL